MYHILYLERYMMYSTLDEGQRMRGGGGAGEQAVENHMPEVIIIDEIGTEAEAGAARTIAQRGVQLVATAHGRQVANLMKNPALSDLVGGICRWGFRTFSLYFLSNDESCPLRPRQRHLQVASPPLFPCLLLY